MLNKILCECIDSKRVYSAKSFEIPAWPVYGAAALLSYTCHRETFLKDSRSVIGMVQNALLRVNVVEIYIYSHCLFVTIMLVILVSSM